MKTKEKQIYVVVAGSFGNYEPEFNTLRMVAAFRNSKLAQQYATKAERLCAELKGKAADLEREHRYDVPKFHLNPLDPYIKDAGQLGDEYCVESIPLLSVVPRRRATAKKKRPQGAS